MNCWFPINKEELIYEPKLNDNFKSINATSCYHSDFIEAMIDNVVPKSSKDETIRRWTSYPNVGQNQEIELTLKNKMDIQSISLYWFDDNQGVRLPQEWRVEY